MKPSEMIKACKAKIATQEQWTTSAFARTKDGFPVMPSSKEAVCFCSLGAIEKVYLFNSLPYRIVKSRLEVALDGAIPAFNDTHTHEEVMAVWDKAIATAEETEAAE